MSGQRLPEAEARRIRSELEAELGRAGIVAAVGSLTPFGDGHSGFTYSTELALGAARRTCVLRISPLGVRIAGPADIGRQGRIMRSLAGTAVPVPEVIACSSEPALAGRSYMLIERIEGVGFLDSGLAGERLAARAIAALHELHGTEPVADREEQALDPEAELERWTGLLARTDDAVRRPGERLLAALAERPPAVIPPRRVHGDFHYGNLLFEQGRVVAMLDWEISSLGSPLTDLGSLIVASVRRRYAEEPNSMGSVEVSPGRLVELYGADDEQARWHGAAACLKYAAIIGFNYELHRSGKREDPEYARLVETMRLLPTDGLGLLRYGFEAV